MDWHFYIRLVGLAIFNFSLPNYDHRGCDLNTFIQHLELVFYPSIWLWDFVEVLKVDVLSADVVLSIE